MLRTGLTLFAALGLAFALLGRLAALSLLRDWLASAARRRAAAAEPPSKRR